MLQTGIQEQLPEHYSLTSNAIVEKTIELLSDLGVFRIGETLNDSSGQASVFW